MKWLSLFLFFRIIIIIARTVAALYVHGQWIQALLQKLVGWFRMGRESCWVTISEMRRVLQCTLRLHVKKDMSDLTLQHYFVRVCSLVFFSPTLVKWERRKMSAWVGLNFWYIFSVSIKNAAIIVSWNSCLLLMFCSWREVFWQYLCAAALSSASSWLWRHLSLPPLQMIRLISWTDQRAELWREGCWW